MQSCFGSGRARGLGFGARTGATSGREAVPSPRGGEPAKGFDLNEKRAGAWLENAASGRHAGVNGAKFCFAFGT